MTEHEPQSLFKTKKNYEIRIPLGDNKRVSPEGSTVQGANSSYANLDLLRKRLGVLKGNLVSLTRDFESVISDYAFLISDDESELTAANDSIWKSLSTNSPSAISYQYYSSLSLLDTTSSRYVRRKYEDYMRDVAGDTSLDLLILINILKGEADLIEQFLDQYITGLNDSSQFRITEFLQDWVETAIRHTKAIYSIYKSRDSTKLLPKEEVTTLSTTEASQSQALFKFKLNSLNEEIVSAITTLKRNFSEYSDLFYNKFLGPSIQLRTQGTMTMYPRYAGVLANELGALKNISENYLTSLLTDFIRRNSDFDKKMTQIENLIAMRNTYRAYIIQLQVQGKVVKSNRTSNTDTTNSYSELDTFAASQSSSSSTANFDSSHDKLSGRLEDTAHPQYLLKSGGEIVGDVTFASGAKIAGMNLALHSHTGTDGSSKISGSNIIPGTLSTDSVDDSSLPALPQQLRVVSQISRPVSLDTNVFDIQIGWDGETGLSYEIQYTPIV